MSYGNNNCADQPAHTRSRSHLFAAWIAQLMKAAVDKTERLIILHFRHLYTCSCLFYIKLILQHTAQLQVYTLLSCILHTLLNISPSCAHLEICPNEAVLPLVVWPVSATVLIRSYSRICVFNSNRSTLIKLLLI